MGILAPTAWNFAGSWRNSLISPSSSMASLQPATSLNVVFGMSLVISLALDLANCMTPRPPPCMLFIRNRKRKTISTIGSSVNSSWPSTLGWGFSELDSSMVPAATCLSTAVSSRGAWPMM